MVLDEFRFYIRSAAAALNDRTEEINRLNVFPVPDGDTGTNMSLTLDMVVQEVMALSPEATLADVRKAITHGSLMGARGNSGVITSQILRGICEGLEGTEEFDATTIATALARAVEVAFHAVRKPVEGTILTVLRDVAEAANTAAEEGLGRDEALHRLSEEAFASVRRTPELLAVLKENGVVDAGGFGLAILIDGFAGAVTGTSRQVPEAASFTQPAPSVAIEQIDDWEGSDYLYCTEFLYKSDTAAPEATLDFLGSMGDCELMVGAKPDYKIHVHTNDPGSVLSYMTERGQVSEVHIHNMRLQSEQRERALGGQAPKPPSEPPKPLGFVAVCSGAGTANILTSQGVDLIVRGGQTMNPSTKDFIDAIAQVNAEQVIIFPNNKNVILAANAAAEIADKPTRVVPTLSVPQSFSAMFVFDPRASLADNVSAMEAAIAQVAYGEVTTAIKDAKAPDGSTIAAGDVIGLVNGSIEVVGSDIATVALGVVGKIVEGADVLTILAGQELAQDEFEALLARIEADFEDLEIDAQRGEQPLYPLVMAAE
ncbi:MAG: DAK2 domain-containing protein [Coriobacteriales bacterium]|jgi:DAK2 domain fusion protein YloV|nr:DAK2 domain-containing protein [Coriobacteriales bacterium]